MKIAKITLSVSTVLLSGGEILCVREGRGKKKGCWNIPTGQPHPGEPLLEAAMRELQEETGVKNCSLTGFLGLYSYWRKFHERKLRLVFLARVEDMPASLRLKVDGKEILEARWITLSDWQEELEENPDCWWKSGILQQIASNIQAGQCLPLDCIHEELSGIQEGGIPSAF
ncbi:MULTISPECIES: NUDIX hydrolase [Alicyclobacillus]|uniref:ADP-ribose pyrophosphatase YjhB, NUDIX family n=1 Tax=Alicyclobacillus tolerans TaxID=90970 RepID=A0A1M6W0A8_9BACL|nr:MULTISPECIES: NUDIX hydrolase [Alicyclobacillus]SHK87147.1 ADP-ribose pyrophosphatase YjhB, NUDIX family [Alicyclobacillus montanus]